VSSESSTAIEKLQAETKELKKQNSELEEASKEKDPSYYDFFSSSSNQENQVKHRAQLLNSLQELKNDL